jgi:nitroreductase/NAD-dependent dihydropyrimidine dehydrogenase PreA subunit
MALIEIDQETCTQCGACIAACGSSIIVPQESGTPRLFPGADPFCARCGHCVGVCPTDSVIHQDIPLDQCPPIDPKLEVSFSQVSQLIRSRRSIREFQDKPVPRDLLGQLIDTVRYAPTGHNLQEVQWLIVDDREKLHRLMAIGLEWCRSLADGSSPRSMEMQGILRMYDLGLDLFLRAVPALVVTFAEKNNPMAGTDCAIALSYFDLAAKSAGLGGFWNGYFFVCAQSFPAMNAALALPQGCLPYAAFGVGYPRFNYQRIPPRKPANLTYLS